MKKINNIKDILLLALLLGFIVFMTERCTYDKLPEPPLCNTIDTVSYSLDIKPIVDANCMLSGCHPDWGDWSDYTILKTRVDNNVIKQRVIVAKNMPPVGQPPLSDDDIKKISCWIDAGAPNN